MNFVVWHWLVLLACSFGVVLEETGDRTKKQENFSSLSFAIYFNLFTIKYYLVIYYIILLIQSPAIYELLLFQSIYHYTTVNFNYDSPLNTLISSLDGLKIINLAFIIYLKCSDGKAMTPSESLLEVKW